ncbi:DinB family protein [Nocardioides sp. 1609]|uniref:DinB family protein n=1 Tax=Nocardioides sp. 1609 TaxID=2508327 RepID=UPI00106F8B34|nr:DinB family protein [Nocardioides sp. 1609]
MPDAPAPIVPDAKDWTWVLDTPCPECGFVAADVDVARVGDAIRADAATWAVVLDGPDPSARPRPDVWSVTEYACHVRDVHRLFAERVRSMLDQDGPHFAGWDQDATAVESRYDQADPAVVRSELLAAADAVAALYDGVPAAALDRTGFRSDGSAFTVDSIARYHLHDVVHHSWDVR